MSSKSTEGTTSNLWCSDCEKKRATQLHPYILCDSCHADRYSMQNVDGKLVPFREVLKSQLKKQGLWFKDGETRGEWHKRMEVEGRSALRRFARGEKGKVGVYKEASRDGGGGS